MVLPTNLYADIFRKKSFHPADNKDFDLNTMIMDSEPRLRSEMEGNSLYQQLVAYTIIINPKKQKVFCAERIGGEPRLIGSYCLGFGGHVDIEDFDLTNTNQIQKTAIRELREELYIHNKELCLKHIGYVRDMTSNTSDHIGVIFLLETGSAFIKEKELLDGKWVSYEDFKSMYYSKLESWSKYIIDYLYETPEWKKYLNF